MKRPEINVKIEQSPYIMKKMDYDEQYGTIYFDRLKRLSPLIENIIDRKFPTIELCKKISNIPQGKVALIGSLFKNSKKIPTLLNQYKTDYMVKEIDFKEETYIDEKDTSYLEDSTGHINLSIDQNELNKLVSGTVLGVIGELENDSNFKVEELIFPYDTPVQTQLLEDDTKSYIALVNDISFSNNKNDLILHNILTNELSFPLIGHSIIIGKHFENINYVSSYDEFLSSICNSLNITLIPARNDPTNVVYPYQSIHPSIFNKASSKSTYQCATNPSLLSINNCKTLILSSDVVKHYLKISSFKTPFEVICHLLQCSHLCPCAPSTFPCFPAKIDPFIIEEFPDVIIVGGFKEDCKSFNFNNSIITIVTVPSFKEDKTIVLFDIDNKIIKPIKID